MFADLTTSSVLDLIESQAYGGGAVIHVCHAVSRSC
jgi:hypothetical protein